MRSLAIAALVSALVGCGGASHESGLATHFRLEGAQFVPGELGDEPHDDAPAVHTFASQNNRLYPGVQGKSIGGTVGPGSTAVLIGMRGDAGHWIVPLAAPDQNTPGDFTFSARGSFSPDVPPGPLTLVMRATSRDGRIGPARLQTMIMDASAPSGALAVQLTWDTEADLDLHVKAPVEGGGTVDIWSRKRTALAPLPSGSQPRSDDEIDAAGKLDMDSNSQCVIDGQRREIVAWPMPAQHGHYEVRVDAFSMCGEQAARWKVRVFRDGTEVLGTAGQLGENDTRFTHGPAAGLLALVFDY